MASVAAVIAAAALLLLCSVFQLTSALMRRQSGAVVQPMQVRCTAVCAERIDGLDTDGLVMCTVAPTRLR